LAVVVIIILVCIISTLATWESREGNYLRTVKW
jgi:hypothetical protein